MLPCRCTGLLALMVVVASGATTTSAQSLVAQPPSTLLASGVREAQSVQTTEPPPDCPGCPPRRLGTAFLQATIINVFYELANLARGQSTARITPETWWINMKRGWEWDLDDFTVNQIGHPYQGNNYFTAGRANGLNFWESSALTAFGSGTWEYFGETNQASLNDFVNTTLGGIALGEMFHRAAWLVRNTEKTGKPRLWSEIGAMAIDPVTGYNRFRSGDASRVTPTPPDMVPSHLGTISSAGIGWRKSNVSDDSSTNGIVELDLLYGNLEEGRSRTPYDAFTVRMTFGGGGPISEIRVRGRLIGQPLHDGRFQLSVGQGYQYNKNDAYQFGAQSFDVATGLGRNWSNRLSMLAIGWGGVTVLGAVDSIPPEGSVVPEGSAEGSEDPGQGVSTGPRFYDYGPGTNFGGLFALRRDRREVLSLSYEAHQLHVLDGARANHFLQRARADVTVPLPGRFGMILTGEFFDRRTYFQLPDVEPAHFHFPQFRIALTWNGS